MRHAHVMALLIGAEDLEHRLTQRLLLAGQLPITARPRDKTQYLPCGLIASEADRNAMDSIAKGGKWLVGVRKATHSSLVNLSAPDFAAFGNVVFVGRSADPADGDKEHIFRWDSAPLSIRTREGFNQLIAMLPDLEQRRAAHRSIVQELEKRRRSNHHQLPLAARLGFDGLLFLATATGELMLVDRLIHTAGAETAAAGTQKNLKALQRQCKAHGAKEVPPYVPARLEVTGDGSKPAIDLDCIGAPGKNWALSIHPPLPASWEPLCYTMKYTAKAANDLQHHFAPCLAVFEALDAASLNAATPSRLPCAALPLVCWPRRLTVREDRGTHFVSLPLQEEATATSTRFRPRRSKGFGRNYEALHVRSTFGSESERRASTGQRV